MTTSKQIKILPRSQSGAALVVSLILLSVMTILAISASQTSRMQEHMAGNARNSDIAFEAAEAGARSAERYISPLSIEPKPCSSASCAIFSVGALPTDLSNQSNTWWETTYGKEYGTTAQEITTAVADPRYVIEYVDFVPDELGIGNTYGSPPGRTYYRTTSRAKGATDKAVAVVQTIYVKRFN